MKNANPYQNLYDWWMYAQIWTYLENFSPVVIVLTTICSLRLKQFFCLNVKHRMANSMFILYYLFIFHDKLTHLAFIVILSSLC